MVGEPHGEKTWRSTASSSAHSNVTPSWSEEKAKVAVVLSVGSDGQTRSVVSGGGVTVQR